jgi:beta-glucanase (GH16 family)
VIALALAGALLAGVLSVAGGTAAPIPQPLGVHGSWRLIFDDEFNGTSLAGTRFSPGWPSTGGTRSGITLDTDPTTADCEDPREVNVGGGVLTLSIVARHERCGGRSKAYAAAIVSTRHTFDFTYGYAEARIWLPGGSAIADWPTFWTDGYSWPEDGEDDIVEGIYGSACWHFHDPSGGPGNCASGRYAGAWHTFGADWERGSVTYYYDGRRVARIASGITNAPMFLVLSFSARAPLVAPSHETIDYVRVWQH